MNNWVYVILITVGLTAICKITSMIIKRKKSASTPTRSTTTGTTSTSRQLPANTRNQNETGVMVYFANDKHGRADREYRFNYKRVYDSKFEKYCWRAYIVRMPSLCGRDPDLHKTHRFTNGNGQCWVCWDSPVNSLKDMQAISRVWADSLQEYIATGKTFG